MNSLIKIASIFIIFATNLFSATEPKSKVSGDGFILDQKTLDTMSSEFFETVSFHRPSEDIKIPSRDYYFSNKELFDNAYESLLTKQIENDNLNINIAISGLKFLNSFKQNPDIKHFISMLNEFLNLKLLLNKERMIERSNKKSLDLCGKEFFSMEIFREFLEKFSDALQFSFIEKGIMEKILELDVSVRVDLKIE